MKVCFLDCDGVINSQLWLYNNKPMIDESKVQLLSKIIHQTDAKIVLSSSWRELRDIDSHRCNSLYTYLTETLKKYGMEIMDHTPTIEEERPLEIFTWLENHICEVESFVILDDDWSADYYKLYGLENNLIKLTFYGDGGLHPEHVEKAIEILNKNILQGGENK